MQLSAVPFLAHALIECIGATSFILYPASQIPNPSREASLVSQLVGGALLQSSLIALIIAFKSEFAVDSGAWDNADRALALAFAFWHVWPCYRAIARIQSRGGEGAKTQQTLGGPVVHLGVHSVLLSAFLWSALQ
ncbi:unnamed protein product [Parascedosporium putredinis]|uniref:Uncharacterized protein n=1 Tax=Parascedosporium putredinis TaxID=1442378 RepID=A0A9P1M9Q8_9PEZI|nr:unnamed protein product [Parascedosporium putredinis]CAI7996063.1 unnamed protein product [Parascedosporium putredinis]